MKEFPRLTLPACLLLCSVYLLYWAHADFFVDDWILLPYFRRALEQGPAGVAGLVADAVRNRIYGVFRTQWLSILYGFGLTAAGGYSVKFNYLALIALHAANGWLLCQALWRLGAGRGVSFLAAALFLVAPTTNWVLFTYFTNPFYVFSTFWVLLMLWFWAWRLDRGFTRTDGLLLASFAVVGLFSGEQVFGLLWLIVPLAWLLLVPRAHWRPAIRSILPMWGGLAAAGAAYLFWISEVSIAQVGYHKRYEWTWPTFRNNVTLIYAEMLRFTGLVQDAFYRIAPETVDATLALGMAGVTSGLLWRWGSQEPPKSGFGRLGLFAALGILVAYGPTLWLAGGYPLRYHYVPSPFLALFGATCLAAAGRGPLRWLAPAAGGLTVGFCVLAVTANLRQGWIPQAAHQRLVVSALRDLQGFEAGDILVIQGTPFEIGTAQHFSMHSPESAGPFVEWLTNVRPEEVVRQLLNHGSHWALYQKMNHQRHIEESDLRRTHVLVYSRGAFRRPHWAAAEVSPGQFRLSPLKGAPQSGWEAEATFSKEQLAMMGDRVYFAKSYPLD